VKSARMPFPRMWPCLRSPVMCLTLVVRPVRLPTQFIGATPLAGLCVITGQHCRRDRFSSALLNLRGLQGFLPYDGILGHIPIIEMWDWRRNVTATLRCLLALFT